MDTFEGGTVTTLQSLPCWVYTIQYILWIVYDVEIYITVVDCDLTVAVIHMSLRHRFTHYTTGQYFWLYMPLTMFEVAKLLTAYVNRLLSQVLTYRPKEIRLSTILCQLETLDIHVMLQKDNDKCCLWTGRPLREDFWGEVFVVQFSMFWYLNVLTSHCVDLWWYPSHVISSRKGAFNQQERWTNYLWWF